MILGTTRANTPLHFIKRWIWARRQRNCRMGLGLIAYVSAAFVLVMIRSLSKQTVGRRRDQKGVEDDIGGDKLISASKPKKAKTVMMQSSKQPRGKVKPKRRVLRFLLPWSVYVFLFRSSTRIFKFVFAFWFARYVFDYTRVGDNCLINEQVHQLDRTHCGK